MNGFPEADLSGSLKISAFKLECLNGSENFWRSHKLKFLAPPPHCPLGRPVAPERLSTQESFKDWVYFKLCFTLMGASQVAQW